MKKLIALLLALALVLGCLSFAAAEGDLFEILEAVTENAGEYWKVSLTVQNKTGETVRNLMLNVCFTDEKGNIIYIALPSASVRLKADKTIALDMLVKKELNPYAAYVDQVDYIDSSEESHTVYLDDTEEFLIDVDAPAAVPAETQAPTAVPVVEETPVPAPVVVETPAAAASKKILEIEGDSFTVYEAIDAIVRASGNTLSEGSREFIEKYEDIFTTKSGIDASLIYDSWNTFLFQRSPKDYSGKLIYLKNVTVSMVPETGTDEISIAAVIDAGGQLYTGLYIGKSVFSENDVIDEICMLPLDWMVQEDIGIVLGLMTLPGNRVENTEGLSSPGEVKVSGDPLQIVSCIAGRNAGLEAVNNTDRKITEIGFRARYYDKNNRYILQKAQGGLGADVFDANWAVFYVGDADLQPGDTLTMSCNAQGQPFMEADHVDLAVNYYLVEGGQGYYVPESELHWYSSAIGDYIDKEYEYVLHEIPDQETVDKAGAFMLGYVSFVLYPEYQEFYGLPAIGSYITEVQEDSFFQAQGIAAGDIIVTLGGVSVLEDPYIIQRAKAKIADGGTVEFVVSRNGELITLPVRMEDIRKHEADKLPEGADRTVKITSEDLTVALGNRKLKLTAEVTALTEDAPAKSTLVWSSDDTTVAKVDTGGNVTGVKPGTAVITCSLKDNPEIKASVKVTVVRAVTGVTLSEKTLTLGKGKTKSITATVAPKDATNQTVSWSTSDPDVAVVSAAGLITAVNGGDCDIVCTTSDGAKTAAVKVHVPTFSVNNMEYTVYSKSGLTIPVNWDASGITLTLTDGGSSYFDANWVDNQIQIIPKKAGKGKVVITNEAAPKDKVTINVTIDHSAVYDTTSYPTLRYDDALRYPDAYKRDKVSFSGKVIQVMSGSSTTSYLIQSSGRKNVYVTIDNGDILTPVIEKDQVTVYGTHDGNKTYTAVLGNGITVPLVKAERIVVK